MLPIRDPPQDKRPTHNESIGLEKNIPSKWTGKTSWGSNTHIRQNRLQNKSHKRDPDDLHNTQWKNPSRGHKHCKHICIQHKSTKYIRKILEDFKKDIDSNTL